MDAFGREVKIRLILESSDESDGKITVDAVHALGEQLAKQACVYTWPLEKRPKNESGKHGSLHIKCAIADEEAVLISSANLTDYALNLNMELGLLIKRGTVPADIANHFNRLICENILEKTHY